MNTIDKRGERVLLFDLLRVVAIGMILFSHVSITIGPPWSERVQPYWGIPNFYWATWGQLGVTLFLVISGLSLEYTYGGGPIPLGKFLIKRIVRIYPIYYLSLLLALGLYTAFAVWGVWRYGKELEWLPGFGAGDLLLALTGFNAFFGKWGGPLVWSSWFIGLVMVLYLGYPWISRLIRRAPWSGLLILAGVSAASRIWVGHTDILSGDPLEWFPPNRVFEFGLGIFLVQAAGPAFFLRFNRWLGRLPGLAYLGALSFPLFLMHDPLRRFIYLGPTENPLSLTLGIPVFLLLSVLASHVALRLHRAVFSGIPKRVGPWQWVWLRH